MPIRLAQVTADRLVRHLAAVGYVVMKRAGAVAPSTLGMVGPEKR